MGYQHMASDITRRELKSELLQRVEVLGLQQAIFPSPEEPIDKIVIQLENINPTPQPLSSLSLPMLEGDWQLIYASKGTVVTRQLASRSEFLGGIKIKRVWQTLIPSNITKVDTTNAAVFELPLLGEWMVQANGVWTRNEDEKTAIVCFDTFSVQATQLFGMPSWSLPQLKIPVLEFLCNEAVWITSYLDEEIRIGRGATGNLFVFHRE